MTEPAAESAGSSIDRQLEYVSPGKLKVSEDNVRNDGIKGPASTWDELVRSIRTQGIVQPPTVDKEYVLIAGLRRVMAAKEAGLDTIPVIRYTVDLPPEVKLGMSVLENENRDAVSPYDRLIAMQKLQRYFKDTQKVADALGLSRRTVQAWLSVAATCYEVPKFKELGVEKQQIVKAILYSPQYRDSPLEEWNKVIELAKKTPQEALRRMKHEAETVRPAPKAPVRRQAITFWMPLDLYAKAQKEAEGRQETLEDWLVRTVREACL